MRVLLQRVSEASVTVDGREVAAIGHGFLLLVGIAPEDGVEELGWMARKVAGLRVFEDDQERMNLSISDIQDTSVLVVSQFTLYGDARKGRRPSFVQAAPPDIAEPLCSRFAELLRHEGLAVQEGAFGEHMRVHLVNDGPVTLLLERPSPA